MNTERLVYMANQIGVFFSSQSGANPQASIANHLKRFWDPRMRRELVAYVAAGGKGVDEVVLGAVGMLDESDAKP